MSDSYIRPDDKPAAADNSHGAEWGAPKAAPSNAMGANVIQKNWQELIRPNKLQVSLGSDPKRQATLIAEPLERGFGVTLGNALRRILLSSLQGAAVQSVHIDGVLHEFSSIAGVREDVTDIVLNIKDIAIKMQGEGPKRMVVKKQGPGTVVAGDIQTGADNDTRFAVLAPGDLDPGWLRAPASEGARRKTTFVFAVRNVPGSLHRSLGAFAERELNLSKLESRPSRTARWEYVFWVDLDADAAEPRAAEALEALRRESEMVRVLGSYAASPAAQRTNP